MPQIFWLTPLGWEDNKEAELDDHESSGFRDHSGSDYGSGDDIESQPRASA
jgi:hypothetical protein